jgi:cytochrome b
MGTPARQVAVWDPVVRVSHWCLAACVLGCLVLYEGGRWHEWLGYGALVLVVGRTVWGLIGPRHARFASFVVGPAHALAYAASLRKGQAPRHLGHNPLGGWMIIALLCLGALAGGSGALYVTDTFWGVGWLYAIHQVSSWSFAVLVPLHVAGVWWSSRQHRENLVLSMFTGRKPAAEPGDVP